MHRILRPLLVNGQLKLAALAMALLLWVSVSAEEPASQWLTVPVEVVLLDPMHTLIRGPIPSEVEVRFSGRGRDLWELAVNRPSLVLPIRNAEENDQIFLLDPEMVRVPPSLEVVARDLRPSSVRVVLQHLARREVPIRVRAPAALPDGLVWVEGPSARPARVEVVGPADQIADIDTLYTVPLEITGPDSALARSVALDTTGFAGIRAEEREVRVSGRVDRLTRRRLQNVPITGADRLRFTPRVANVEITGAESRVRSVRPGQLRVQLELDSLPEAIPPVGVDVPLRVEGAPSGVSASATPAIVRVRPVPQPRQVEVPDSIAQDSAGIRGLDREDPRR